MAKALKMLRSEIKTLEQLVSRDWAGNLRHFKVEQDSGALVLSNLSWPQACDLAADINEVEALFAKEPAEVSTH